MGPVLLGFWFFVVTLGFFFFLYSFLLRWDFGGQWAMVAWWRRGGGDWAVEVR